MSVAEIGYLEETFQVYRADDGLWYMAIQHETGEWTYLPPELSYDPDGRSYIMAGTVQNESKVYVYPYELGNPVVVRHETPVVDPGYDPMPIDGLSFASAKNLTIEELMPKGRWLSRRGLFYREPIHGKWYESKWLWFCTALTLVFAMIWWWQMLHDPTMGYAMLHPFDASVDGDSVFLAWCGWLYWGWMIFLPGITGALQKEGYKRFAVVYSVVLTIVIHLFLSRSKSNSPHP